MKRFAKKCMPLLLIAALLVPCCTVVSCGSSRKSNTGQEVMYKRKQTNKGSKVNSNIKVRGTNKRNRHTTRTY